MVGGQLNPTARVPNEPSFSDQLGILFRWTVNIHKPTADALALTATPVTTATIIPFQCRLVDAYLHPKGALAANGLNFAVITIGTNNSAGGAMTTLAGTKTNIVSFAVGSSYLLFRFDNVNDLSPGQSLCYSITKVGTGVIVPAFEISVILEKI
jgi:hypothetical protein